MGGERSPGTLRRFWAGTGYLGRGLRLWITSPRIMIIGAIPAVIVSVFYAVAIVLFAINIDVITTWATPFADGWAEVVITSFRFFVGVGLVTGLLILGIFTFVAVTLAVGDPFYEKIWREVETRLGDAPADLDESFWTATSRGLANGLRLLLATAAIGVLLFAAGFIPIVGQIGAPVAGAVFGGWFLALELSGFAFDARALPLKTRRRMLGANRPTALGFGVLTYLLFLIPGAAIIVMPAAVAGATLLSRDALAAASVPPSSVDARSPLSAHPEDHGVPS